MRNQTKTLLFVPMLFLITWSLSCAALVSHSPPELANRTLRLSLDQPQAEYQWEQCVSEVLGVCFKSEMRKETYDLRDPEVRKKLIFMGFVLHVREKP